MIYSMDIICLFQWAKIVLILEQSLSPAVRVSVQHKYSTPVWDGRQDRAMIIQTENEVMWFYSPL